jgi:two-component system sensor histidine kinase RegB
MKQWPISLFDFAKLGHPLGTSGWLYQLRWFAVVGQAFTVLGAAFFYEMELPWQMLGSLMAVIAVTNVVYGAWLRWGEHLDDEGRLSFVAALVLLLDLLILAGMLYVTGGSENPFSSFMFVNLAVAGIIVQPVWAWSLTAIAIGCFAWVTYHCWPLPGISGLPISEGALFIRTHGKVVAFSTCAIVISYFVTRLAATLTARQQALREAQQERDRSQRLEALATFAAGAAHELASPLSTIAVVARELSHRSEQGGGKETLHKDVQLIDSELEHCRQILSRMRSHAGDTFAETIQRATLGDLLDATLDGVREPNRIEVEIHEADESAVLRTPVAAVAQVLRNLLHNALDASPTMRSVSLEAGVKGECYEIVVRDQGMGMTEEVLHRLGEPFFTTKEPGHGMGMGLFLTRNVVKRLGGNVSIESLVGIGTTVTVSLPLESSM